MPDKVLYYVVSVANSGRVALRWSAPFDTAAEAKDYLRRKVDDGDCTMGCVVRFGAGRKQPLSHYLYPGTAEKIVKHWLDINDACEESP